MDEFAEQPAGKPKRKAAAWLLWLLFGWLGADRIYLDRWAAGLLEAALTGASAVFLFRRPTQILLSLFGASALQYAGNVDPGSLWEAEAMLCCLSLLACLKLTDAANLNRAVENANLPPDSPKYLRMRLPKPMTVLLTGLPLALGLVADAAASGFSAYATGALGLSGAPLNRLAAVLHTSVLLPALLFSLGAASRASSAFARVLFCLPPLLLLGMPALYHLFYGWLGMEQLAFLLPGPFSAEWLRIVIWNNDASLAALVAAAQSKAAQAGVFTDIVMIQGGLGVGIAAILLAAAALVPWRRPASQRNH